MNVFRITCGFGALALTLACSQFASAQFGPAKANVNLTYTGWMGQESLSGMGQLGFVFLAYGQVGMFDESFAKTNRPVEGTWQTSGDEVVILFQNCVYVGRINNGVMQGTAAFTANPQVTWQWSVKYDPSIRPK